MSMTRDVLLALGIFLSSSLIVCNIPFLYNGGSSTNLVKRREGHRGMACDLRLVLMLFIFQFLLQIPLVKCIANWPN